MTATASDDQVAAATRDARRILAASDTTGFGVRDVPEADAGPYVRKLVDGLRKARRRGWMRSCRHLPGSGPQPVWLFGWKPTKLFCSRCAAVEHLRITGTAEDHVCDVCRHTVPTQRVMRVATGPYVVLYGACEKCYAVETASGWAE